MVITDCHASSWPTHPPFSALALASQAPTRSWERRRSECRAFWELQKSCRERSEKEKGEACQGEKIRIKSSTAASYFTPDRAAVIIDGVDLFRGLRGVQFGTERKGVPVTRLDDATPINFQKVETWFFGCRTEVTAYYWPWPGVLPLNFLECRSELYRSTTSILQELAGPPQRTRQNEAKRFIPSIQCLHRPQDITHIRPPPRPNLPVAPADNIVADTTTATCRAAILLHTRPARIMAGALNRPQAKDDEGPCPLPDWRLVEGHDRHLGRLRAAHVGPPPAHLRQAAQGRRGHDQAALARAEVPPVQARGMQHWCLCQR